MMTHIKLELDDDQRRLLSNTSRPATRKEVVAFVTGCVLGYIDAQSSSQVKSITPESKPALPALSPDALPPEWRSRYDALSTMEQPGYLRGFLVTGATKEI